MVNAIIHIKLHYKFAKQKRLLHVAIKNNNDV